MLCKHDLEDFERNLLPVVYEIGKFSILRLKSNSSMAENRREFIKARRASQTTVSYRSGYEKMESLQKIASSGHPVRKLTDVFLLNPLSVITERKAGFMQRKPIDLTDTL